MKKKVNQAQVAGFVLGSVVVGFIVDVLYSRWPGNETIFATFGALIVILTFVVPHDGLLRRTRYGRARGVKIIAILLLASYPVAANLLLGRPGPLSAITPAACLWLATSLLLWTSSHADFADVATTAACSLLGVTVLLLGASALREDFTLLGVAGLLLGVAVLLLGVAGLLLLGAEEQQLEGFTRAGVADSLAGTALVLFGVAGLLVGAALVLFGVAGLREHYTLPGVAILLAASAALLIGVAGLLVGGLVDLFRGFRSFTPIVFFLVELLLFGVAGLLFGVAGLLFGVAALREGFTLLGVAALLLGVAVLLLLVAPGEPKSFTPFGAAGLLLGVAVLLFGVAALREGFTLLGVAGLLLSVAVLVAQLQPSSRIAARARDVKGWLLAGSAGATPALTTSQKRNGLSRPGSSWTD